MPVLGVSGNVLIGHGISNDSHQKYDSFREDLINLVLRIKLKLHLNE